MWVDGDGVQERGMAQGIKTLKSYNAQQRERKDAESPRIRRKAQKVYMKTTIIFQPKQESV